MINASEIPTPQEDREPSYWPRRKPEDSRIDPYKSIASQFDILRVSDTKRYPAFFDFRGETFELKLEKRKVGK
jgi:methionyl-tRNA formyltransferase